MAPEQAVGQPADVRTDLYAVGVVLYELLTGQVPFYAPEPVVLLHLHAYEPLPPFRSLNPRILAGVEQFLLCALAKDPAARYQAPPIWRLIWGVSPTSSSVSSAAIS